MPDFDIAPLGPPDAGRVIAFWQSLPQGQGAWAQFEAARLAQGLQRGLHQENEVFAAQHESVLAGLAWLQHRRFDSEHFGVRVAHLNALAAEGDYRRSREVKERLVSHGLRGPAQAMDYVVARLAADDLSGLHALEANGFQLLAPMVNLLWTAGRPHPPAAPGLADDAVPFCPEDLDALKTIALACFTHSRFHMEIGWPKAKSDELHARWIENCCVNGLADLVLVAKDGGRPVGFIACKVEDFPGMASLTPLGTIVLLGVATEAQGRGLGVGLVRAAQRWFAERVQAVEVRTEAHNYASLRTYQATGFKPVDHSLYLRRWQREGLGGPVVRLD